MDGADRGHINECTMDAKQKYVKIANRSIQQGRILGCRLPDDALSWQRSWTSGPSKFVHGCLSRITHQGPPGDQQPL